MTVNVIEWILDVFICVVDDGVDVPDADSGAEAAERRRQRGDDDEGEGRDRLQGDPGRGFSSSSSLIAAIIDSSVRSICSLLSVF